MNSRILLAAALAAASSLSAADAPAVPPCCPPADATPACCATTKPAGDKPAVASCCEEIKPAAPLSNRSLYQHDAIWTNDANRPVRLVSLRGQPVIVAMFFASCEYACPVLVNDLQRLRAALPAAERDRTQIVLVSFDTARDTPAALKAFRERMTLDDHWTLLRGEPSAVQDLAMLLGVKFKQDARGQFAHSNLFTVLNAGGEIVHQHAGLQGDISDAAKAVALAAK